MTDLKKFTDEQLTHELVLRGWPGEVKQYEELEEEVRNLSKKLLEAEKGKSDFLSNVRNEINNPLTSILGLSESISQLTADKKIVQLGRLIHLEAFELDYQIRNIIAAAEVEAGEITIQPSRVNITSLIDSQIAYLHPRIASAFLKVNFQKERGASPIVFNTDAYLLQNILVNVLANAIEFSEQKGSVSVRSWLSEENLFVEVQDFGVGVEPSKQKRIFERFHQIDSGSTKLHKGQGLGLAIVAEFVSILGGGVRFDSQTNVGTTVTIQIPELLSQHDHIDSSSFGNEIVFNDQEEF